MNMVATIDTLNIDKINAITADALAPMVRQIDEERIFPEEVMRAYGGAGAFATHLAGPERGADLTKALTVMAKASEKCLSTGFCVWCQDTLGWYIASSDNDFLKTNVLPKVATGEVLGGTGMSNPLKALGEIEPMRLKGVAVQGGYKVKGVLPWVSNLLPDGYFGSMFDVAVEGESIPKRVMAIVHAGWHGVRLTLDHTFVAMGGTATCGVQMRDVFVPTEYVLGDPAGDYFRRIRPGFIILQCGMAAGIIRNCIDLMKQVAPALGHVNRYLEKQPTDLEAEYDALMAEVLELAKTPYDTSDAFLVRVLKARLKGGELAVETAHFAQLHCGARGYVANGDAQRRLREAYFVAIVTPATKHLRKMIAELVG